MSPVKRICVFEHSVMTNFKMQKEGMTNNGDADQTVVWTGIYTVCPDLYVRILRIIMVFENYHKTPKNLDTQKIAVTVLKLE